MSGNTMVKTINGVHPDRGIPEERSILGWRNSNAISGQLKFATVATMDE